MLESERQAVYRERKKDGVSYLRGEEFTVMYVRSEPCLCSDNYVRVVWIKQSLKLWLFASDWLKVDICDF